MSRKKSTSNIIYKYQRYKFINIDMLKILQIKHFTKKEFVIVIQSSTVIHVHKNKRFT